MARQYGHPNVDDGLAVQAAELGLANAVLAWRRPDSRAFTGFARGAITTNAPVNSTVVRQRTLDDKAVSERIPL